MQSMDCKIIVIKMFFVKQLENFFKSHTLVEKFFLHTLYMLSAKHGLAQSTDCAV